MVYSSLQTVVAVKMVVDSLRASNHMVASPLRSGQNVLAIVIIIVISFYPIQQSKNEAHEEYDPAALLTRWAHRRDGLHPTPTPET